MGDEGIDKTKGDVKAVAGKATGDRDLEAEGRTESTVAGIRQGAGDMAGKAKDAASDVAGKAGALASDVVDKTKDVVGDVADKGQDIAGR